MLINNKNISTFKATLIDRDITENSTASGVSWEASASSPIERGIQRGFKSMSLVFLFKCADEDEFYKNKSRLISDLTSCNIRFEDIDLEYRCWLDGVDSNDKIKNGIYKTTVNLICDYAKGDSIHMIKEDVESFIIENKGTHAAPIFIKISSNKITSEITILGFTEPISIEGLAENDSIIINSMDGTITGPNGENYFKYFNSWAMPLVYPGISSINLSTGCNVELSFNELF